MTGMEDVLAAHSGHAFGREESDESRWFDKCECGHLLFGTDYSPEHKMRPGKSYANAAFAAHVAEALTAAGYRKPRTITEYSIVFNGHASGLIPPAVSIAEFQERYERETGWMLTDRDVYIQRTFQTVDPEFGDWELMPTTAPEPLP